MTSPCRTLKQSGVRDGHAQLNMATTLVGSEWTRLHCERLDAGLTPQELLGRAASEVGLVRAQRSITFDEATALVAAPLYAAPQVA